VKVREPVARPLDVVAAELLLSASQAFLVGVLVYLAMGVWEDRGVAYGPVAIVVAGLGVAVGAGWLYWLLGGVGWPLAAANVPTAMFLGFALVLGWQGDDLFRVEGIPLLLSLTASVYGIVCGAFLDSPRRLRWDQRQRPRPGTTVPRVSPVTRTVVARVPRSLPKRPSGSLSPGAVASVAVAGAPAGSPAGAGAGLGTPDTGERAAARSDAPADSTMGSARLVPDEEHAGEAGYGGTFEEGTVGSPVESEGAASAPASTTEWSPSGEAGPAGAGPAPVTSAGGGPGRSPAGAGPAPVTSVGGGPGRSPAGGRGPATVDGPASSGAPMPTDRLEQAARGGTAGARETTPGTTTGPGGIELPTSVEPRAQRSPWAWAAPPEWSRDEEDEPPRGRTSGGR
jgi:hypothetical protein